MKNNKKPEILLVTRPLTPPWDEASKNFAFNLAKNLGKFRFHILVGKYDSTLSEHIVQHVIYRGPEWTTIQKTKLVLKLFLLLKRNPQINIVHLLFAPTPFNITVLKSLVSSFKVKVVQTIASVPLNAKERIGSSLFGDQFVVYSKHARSILENVKNGKLIKKKISEIPPFIDFSQFSPPTKKGRETLREKWNVEKDEKIILFPGEYSRLGAMDNLLKGFRAIKDKLPQAKLFMACRIKKKEDKKIERQFKKDISNIGLSSSVYFLGKVENIKELYWVADLTVFPVAKMEGKSLEGKFDFPFVLLESLACGTPILTSDIGALPEIWQNSKYKELFAYKEKSEFFQKAIEILGEDFPVKRKELSNYAQNRFDSKKILNSYADLYKKLLS